MNYIDASQIQNPLKTTAKIGNKTFITLMEGIDY